MSNYFRAIATDLDGTLTAGGVVDSDALGALKALRDDGLSVLLVTGRIADEMDAEFPGLAGQFDAVVTENGAVVTTSGGARLLAPPVEPALEKALAERGVRCRRGRVLLACDGAHAGTVSEEVARLGLDCHLVHNRAALMVLPAGVSKGRGLFDALGALGISHHNTVAVGDAENDLSLLQIAEVGVAVADAVPSLREHADLVLDEPAGAAVAVLARGPLLSGQQRLCPRRRWLVIGARDDGTPARVPGSQANLLITGDSGAGKSYTAGLLAEQWVEAGYTLLVIDPEGDHSGLAQLPGVIYVDAAVHLPSPAELVGMLRTRFVSVVLDLTVLPPEEKTAYVRHLPALIDAERLRHGVPHWVLADEAHLPTGGTDGIEPLVRPLGRGLCLVTYRPDLLPDQLHLAVDLTITPLGPPEPGPPGPRRGRATLTEPTGTRPFTLGVRRTPHARHEHKYTEAQLPEGRRFYFHSGAVAPAGNLVEFRTAMHRLSADAVTYHAARGDFSRWIAGTLQDPALAQVVVEIEHDLMARTAANVERARDALDQAVAARYHTDSRSDH